MSDQTKKDIVKTKIELMKVASEKVLKLQQEGLAPKSGWGTIGKFLEEFNKADIENEAKKSPDQIALEKKLQAQSSSASQKERILKESQSKTNLFIKWLKHDTWHIYDEALVLFQNIDPIKDYHLGVDEDLWKLVKSCGGHSLQIANINSPQKDWRVAPKEWVRWLTEKGYPVRKELISLTSHSLPDVPVQPRLFAANLAKDVKKKERLKALKIFVADIAQRARANNMQWNPVEIHITKNEFLAIFLKRNPQIEVIKIDTFNNDITDIGIKFKRGIKTNKNNDLNKLFAISK